MRLFNGRGMRSRRDAPLMRSGWPKRRRRLKKTLSCFRSENSTLHRGREYLPLELMRVTHRRPKEKFTSPSR